MITITDFYTNKCSPCKQLSPILDEIADERDDINLIKIDCEENMELAIQNGVRSVPLLIIQSGSSQPVRIQGFRTKEDLLDIIDSIS
jgi:thioredoxin 1